MPSHGSVAARVREDREKAPHLYYGRSLWRAKVGDEIVEVSTGRRAEVLSTTLEPNRLWIRLRTGVSCAAHGFDFRHVDQTEESYNGRGRR